jgi:superfamily II DNA/RNA helicase
MAFLIPLAQRLLEARDAQPISALIITPTRELAAQIVVEAQKLLGGSALSVGSVIGGTNMKSDGKHLRSHILVAVRALVLWLHPAEH